MIWKKDEQSEPGVEMARPIAEKSGGEVTIIGQGARLEGAIVSAGSLQVDGRVKGTIHAEGDVLLSPSSVVEADIKATNVSVAGTLKGDIVVNGTAELQRGGRIEGNITSKTLVIQEGGLFSGQSVMETSPAPDKQPSPQKRPASDAAAQGATPDASGGRANEPQPTKVS